MPISKAGGCSMIVFTDLDPFLIDQYSFGNQIFDEYRFYDFGRMKFDPEIPKMYGIIPNYEIFTKEEIADYTGPLFDAKYAQYLYNGAGFLAFMAIAMREYFRGDITYIYLIDRSPLRDCLVENLAKLLFERYGIESAVISMLEDLWSVKKNNSLSINGLNNIGFDINRVLAINPKMVEDIQNGKV